jgi:hypothetical protein
MRFLGRCRRFPLVDQLGMATKKRPAKKAKSPLNSIAEAQSRERIYRSMPITDVRRLMGHKSAKYVADLATRSGLPIGGDVVDLYRLFPAIDQLSQRASIDAVDEDGRATICRTKFEAAEALKKRIGRGSPRMLTDWMKAGMPGTAGGRGIPGRFPIEEMVAWAKDNLDDLKPEGDEASLLALEMKRKKDRLQALAIEDREQDREERRGNILPRDEFSQFLRDAIVVARQQLLSLPKELAGLISDARQQRIFFNEATRATTTILGGLEAEFARGPA